MPKSFMPKKTPITEDQGSQNDFENEGATETCTIQIITPILTTITKNTDGGSMDGSSLITQSMCVGAEIPRTFLRESSNLAASKKGHNQVDFGAPIEEATHVSSVPEVAVTEEIVQADVVAASSSTSLEMDHPYVYTPDTSVQEKNSKKKREKASKFLCLYCDKTFDYQYTLNRHLPVHTNERRYRCLECGKAFRQASTLCRHKVTHYTDKEFKCEICDKSFNRASSKIAHEKTHQNEFEHVCPTCGRGFHQKGNLKSHMFIHSGEKPYSCQHCNKTFNQASNLRSHMNMGHKQIVQNIKDGLFFHCRICQLSFKNPSALKSHEAENHMIMPLIPGIGQRGEVRESQRTNRVISTLTPGVAIQTIEKKVVGPGRAINDPQCRTVTMPNGDKTIKFNDLPVDPWVAQAASILMELESGCSTRSKSPAALESSTPPASGDLDSNGLPAGVITEFVDSVKVDVAELFATGDGLSLGLHRIGMADDGQTIAILVKEDKSCTLVKIAAAQPIVVDGETNAGNVQADVCDVNTSVAAGAELTCGIAGVESNLVPQAPDAALAQENVASGHTGVAALESNVGLVQQVAAMQQQNVSLEQPDMKMELDILNAAGIHPNILVEQPDIYGIKPDDSSVLANAVVAQPKVVPILQAQNINVALSDGGLVQLDVKVL